MLLRIKEGIYQFQLFIHFSWQCLVQTFRGKFYWRDLFAQFDRIGAGSFLIVALTGIFTGMVFTLQTGVGMQRFGVTNTVGRIVVLGIVKELGPVLSAVVFAGRAGAAIAAQISSMVVSEQIDAIEAEGIDPIKRVVVSRVLACFFMLPILTIIADALALMGGAIICDYSLGVGLSLYWNDVYSTLETGDILMGFIKPFFFGAVVGLCGTFYGMSADREARGVGRATTRAVVSGTIVIILLDFLITKFMIYLFGS